MQVSGGLQSEEIEKNSYYLKSLQISIELLLKTQETWIQLDEAEYKLYLLVWFVVSLASDMLKKSHPFTAHSSLLPPSTAQQIAQKIAQHSSKS